MPLKIFNTQTKKKEKFIPKKDKLVNIYVCGPTVYDYDHLGHARVGIFYDIVRRYLLSEGFKVKFVQNITDVGHLTDDADTGEDKITKKAKKVKKDPQEIAKYYEKAHFQDMAELNVLKPDFSPKATEVIPEIIDFIQKLIKKGRAYVVEGSVYFDITKFSDYGKLSKRDFSEQLAGARVKIKEHKKNPLDFALWISADKKHLMQWQSPWSRGFPGWHIECSAINQKFFPEGTDIHGGAVELVFPHHENELAQSESLGPKPFVKYWVHLGLVLLNGLKMSKSKANFIYIRDLLKNTDSDTIRIAMLLTHYRKPLDWKEAVLILAKNLKNKILSAKNQALNGEITIKNQIQKSLNNDFNTPEAFKMILEKLNKLTLKDFEYLKKIFGLKLEILKIPLEIQKLVQKREELRIQKKFLKADILRKKIETLGFIIEDTDQGPKISAKG